MNIPRNFDDTSNSDTFCPVLPAGRAAAPRTSARRHLRGGGRPLPRHEGAASSLLTADCLLLHLPISQVGPLFGVPVDLFSPLENKVRRTHCSVYYLNVVTSAHLAKKKHYYCSAVCVKLHDMSTVL